MSKQIDPAHVREYAGEKLQARTPFKSPVWKWNGQAERFEKDPSKPDRDESLNPYLPGEELCEIVRLAQILGRPVVLKGEPGCGKTQLARAVAFEWYAENYRSKYFEWNIKSSSKAADGIYTFDHIERLRWPTSRGPGLPKQRNRPRNWPKTTSASARSPMPF